MSTLAPQQSIDECAKYLLAQKNSQPHLALLGGCGQFGMNLTLYVAFGQVLLVDCGSLFPEPWQQGVDCIVPDAHDLLSALGGVSAYLLTHGHEDHIGGMPYYLDEHQAPVYGTEWTLELLARKLERQGKHHLLDCLHVVQPDESLKLAKRIHVDFIPVDHSIPHSCALSIQFGDYRVFHSGDLKHAQPFADLSGHVWHKKPTFKQTLKGSENQNQTGRVIDLMLTDSTNAKTPGHSGAEQDVLLALEELVGNTSELVLLTTFASNAERLLGILKLAKRLGRKLFALGHGVEQTFDIAEELGYLGEEKSALIRGDDWRQFPREQLLVIATGSQGEPFAALTRLSQGAFRGFQLKPGDHVVYSARMIPGNERVIYDTIGRLEWMGVCVTTPKQNPKLHVSGHGSIEDLRTLIDDCAPKHYLPIHGTYAHLLANHQVSQTTESRPKALLGENGDVFKLSAKGTEKVCHVMLDRRFIDSETSHSMSYGQIRDRFRIGRMGVIFFFGHFDPTSPDHDMSNIFWRTIGLDELIYDDLVQDWLEHRASKALKNWSSDVENFNEMLKFEIGRFLKKRTGKKPVLECHVGLS